MECNEVWLWGSVQPLLRALGARKFRVEAFVAYPQEYGSWHVDLLRGRMSYRISANGIDQNMTLRREIVFPTDTAPGVWKDFHTFSPDADGRWIDEVVAELERQPA